MNTFGRREFWLNLSMACVLAIVAAVPIVMSAVMQQGFEIGKLALAQPLAILAAGAVLTSIGPGWVLRREAAANLAFYSLLAFAGLAAISAALADHPEVALFGSYGRHEGLFAWIAYCAFFLAVTGATDRADGVERFVDVMLIASVVPAAYAMQQRLQLDFYPLGVRDASRSDGTLGSPVFMAAYMAALIPVTAARCWQTRRSRGEFVLWSAILLTQVGGILVTQTRGPLIALLMGLLLFAFCMAGRLRLTRLFAGAAGAFALMVAFISAINVLAPAQQWAQQMPVVSRLVFSLEPSADGQTQRASRSALSRAVIWRAGVETFHAAPLERQLLGYGPDCAAEQFFPRVPPAVVRLVGYGEEHSFDRMHADVLDITLNFGVIAWLAYALFFGSVIYASAQALWNCASLRLYAAAVIGTGTACSAAIYLIGYPAAVAPAFGIGCGIGVFLFMAACAVRSLHGPPSSIPASQWALLAALTTALWVFWMDAQINVPVPATRLISFGLAALILVVAARVRRGDDGGAAAAESGSVDWRAYGIACAAVATLGTCLPNALYDPSPDFLWLRRMVPILALVGAGTAAIWVYARRNDARRSRRAAMIAASTVFIYLLVHVALIARPDEHYEVPGALAIAVASVAATVFVGLMCLAFAWRQSRDAAAPERAWPGRWSRGGIALTVFAMLVVACFDWQARRAEVDYTLAARVAWTHAELSEHLVEAAIDLRPYERYYRRQLALGRLLYAIGGMRQLETTPPQSGDFRARLEFVMRKLAAAETAARTGAAIFPRDPWMVGALANVLQIRALKALRPLDPEASVRAAREADELYAKAHRIFPAEPLILRNWAQFLAEQGDLQASYRVFDRMETLIPDDIAAYAARIDAARLAHDAETVEHTLVRARRMLQPAVFKELTSVANMQQVR